ncbi:glutathione S-transferase family protein [Phenylobacterium sp. J426]|uniref:glutathione S-transferase family protein n=1 Tax=Phenylobacterium sp. J426 TaxID=2898439 RepID=UPI0021509263|nr:glutathione S-transferase family protein [Phenylobacterium sp. J426]MCR5872888.1 glutathione S-transferase family protein [Phenylobacterium sp. J426]
MITLYAFKWVPPFAQGLVRDLRVRWALEEAGVPYATRLLGLGDQDQPEYRAIQPWGQVPAIEEDGLVLFESGAIVLHIAERSEALMPRDPAGRAKTVQWVTASLDSVDAYIGPLADIDLFHAGEAWTAERRPQVVETIRRRLDGLARRLDGREHLEDRFTAGDLMMATVLRGLRDTDLVTGHPVLGPYLARCEARPAFGRALEAQLAPFRENEPAMENA